MFYFSYQTDSYPFFEELQLMSKFDYHSSQQQVCIYTKGSRQYGGEQVDSGLMVP